MFVDRISCSIQIIILLNVFNQRLQTFSVNYSKDIALPKYPPKEFAFIYRNISKSIEM